MKNILILANNYATITKFRSETIEKLLEEEFQVYLSVPNDNTLDSLINKGLNIIDTNMDRRGKNPLKDFALIKQYRKIIKEIKPNIILTYTIKPNIYGNLAAKKYKVPVISTVTGLGDAVENGGIMQRFLILLMRVMRKSKAVVFQNDDNLQFCEKYKIINNNAVLVNGSGVNLEKFQFIKNENNSLVTNFLFVGRMLKDKGIEELKQAYLNLYENNKNISLTLIGDYTPGYEAFFDGLEEYNIFYKGYQTDVKPFLNECDAIVLPSYHEGMANVLLEAAATGRAIIASDIPGCRETFDDGVTGLSFKSKNVESLQCAMEKFAGLTNEEQVNMGMLGRKKVEEQFNRVDVVNAYITEIEKYIK
ncbi:MAG: glycosyltransferase family 4 protein [Bacillota bacterium]